MKEIKTFINRLNKLNIKVELTGNFPWIYLSKVNGNLVKEKFLANHGFTIAFVPKPKKKLEFTNIKYIFEIIRKYK